MVEFDGGRGETAAWNINYAPVPDRYSIQCFIFRVKQMPPELGIAVIEGELLPIPLFLNTLITLIAQ